MNSQEGLHPEIRKEIMNKKENMRTKKLNESELKKIAQSMGEQERQVEEILSPKITVGKREIEEVQEIIQ